MTTMNNTNYAQFLSTMNIKGMADRSRDSSEKPEQIHNVTISFTQNGQNLSV